MRLIRSIGAVALALSAASSCSSSGSAVTKCANLGACQRQAARILGRTPMVPAGYSFRGGSVEHGEFGAALSDSAGRPFSFTVNVGDAVSPAFCKQRAYTADGEPFCYSPYSKAIYGGVARDGLVYLIVATTSQVSHPNDPAASDPDRDWIGAVFEALR